MRLVAKWMRIGIAATAAMFKPYRSSAVGGVILVLAALIGPVAAKIDPPAHSEVAVQVPEPIRGRQYALVKDWNFASTVTTLTALRQEFYTRYAPAGGKLDHLTGEWERYRDNNNHVFDEDGLSLIARLVGSMEPGNIESGMLRSKWAGTYGYFEARLKLPRGRGMWPAFWVNAADGKWPPEIDVMEVVNNGTDSTKNSFHFLHGTDTSPSFASKLDVGQSYRPGFDYADDFHTFAIEWCPTAVRHFVDGVSVVERRFAWRHDDGTDAGPAQLLVNLAVGGNWSGAPAMQTDFPAQLEVAFVRIWQTLRPNC